VSDFTLDEEVASSDHEDILDNDETAESSTAQDEMDDSSTSEDLESETGELESEDDADPIKALKSEKANQRFSEVTARANAAEAKLAALTARLDAMDNAQEPAFDDSNPPKLDDFDDYDSFTNAQQRYTSRQVAHEERAIHRQTQKEAYGKQEDAARFSEHQRKREALLVKHPDFLQGLESMQLDNRTQGGAATAQAILRTDNGDAVEYHLTKNPAIAVSLNGMDQYDAIREVARISERLKVKPKKRADLPDPIGSTPSGGGKSGGFKPKYSAGATFS
jgi:hypothetical protein